MENKNKWWVVSFCLLFVLLFSALAFAVPHSPNGDIHLKHRYAIVNATNWVGNLNASDYNVTGDNFFFSDGTIANLTVTSSLTGELSCENITGSTSDLCTIVSKMGDGLYLYNDSATIYFNESVLNATIDARENDTLYTAGDGLTLTGTIFTHNDTSSQASSDNTGRTYVQDIILDTYGHITSLVTAVETVVDTFWPLASQEYLYNNTGTLDFNETKLNETVDTRATVVATSINTDCNATGSCGNVTYLDYDNVGNLNITGNMTFMNGDVEIFIDGANGRMGIGDVGDFEQESIDIDGIEYNFVLRVNDVGGSELAQNVIHRHSEVGALGSALIGARANSANSSHINPVTNGMSLLRMIGVGWVDPHYDQAAEIEITMDQTGTINDTSSPGRIVFKTTPEGSDTPIERGYINSSGNLHFYTNVTADYFSGNGSLLTDTNNCNSTGTCDVLAYLDFANTGEFNVSGNTYINKMATTNSGQQMFISQVTNANSTNFAFSQKGTGNTIINSRAGGEIFFTFDGTDEKHVRFNENLYFVAQASEINNTLEVISFEIDENITGGDSSGESWLLNWRGVTSTSAGNFFFDSVGAMDWLFRDSSGGNLLQIGSSGFQVFSDAVIDGGADIGADLNVTGNLNVTSANFRVNSTGVFTDTNVTINPTQAYCLNDVCSKYVTSNTTTLIMQGETSQILID